MTKTGGGILVLSNANNSYTGATTINGGVVSVDTLAAAGSNCGIGAGSSLALDGGTLKYTGGSIWAFDRSISLGTNGGTIDQSGNVYHVVARRRFGRRIVD